jgi:hypothetical protein
MIDDSCKLVLIDFGFMNTIASDEDIKSIDTLIFSFLSLGIYNLEILEYMKDTYFITLKTYSTLTSEISLKTREQYALTKINPQIFRMENFKKLVPQELSFS